MSAWLAPPLLAASLAMVLLALIPRRLWYVQLPAVLGWAAVWVDGHVTGHGLDVAGFAVVAVSLGALALRRGRSSAVSEVTGWHHRS